MDNQKFIIPSIAHKDYIEQWCEPLQYIGKIRYFALCIIFNNGHLFILSNTPQEFLELYWLGKLNLHDHSTSLDLFLNADFFLCKHILGADNILKETLEEKFNMFRTYYFSRTCAEGRFVVGALHDHMVNDPQTLYKNTIHKMEDFCLDFIDKSLDIIKLYNPTYNRSIILNDKYYRKLTIKKLLPAREKLNEKEITCLYWAAHGKSSEETAIIMKAKKTSVETYRKQIREKLNCSTMAQAVYEGIKHGYIGAFANAKIVQYNNQTVTL